MYRKLMMLTCSIANATFLPSLLLCGAPSTHPHAVKSHVHHARVKQRAQLVAQIAQAKAQEVQPSQCSMQPLPVVSLFNVRCCAAPLALGCLLLRLVQCESTLCCLFFVVV